MKKLYLYIIGISIALNLQAQTTLKDFIGLPIGPEIDETFSLFTDSMEVSGMSPLQQAAFSQNRNYNHIPYSYSIDTSKDMGEIPYESSVDASGNFNIFVPVKLYENPRGLTPEVGLAYNSGVVSKGPLGVGWNLKGASFINRTNKSYYYDGYVEGVYDFSYHTLSADHTFLLDGVRLIYKGEVEANKKTLYESESGNIRVYGYINQTYGKEEYFEVIYPDGKKATYGQKGKTESISFLTYPLTEVKDPKGNIIKYHYTLSDNAYRLDKITYGEKERIAVEFTYTHQTVFPMGEFYLSGHLVSYKYQLAQIQTKLDNTVLYTYNLKYTTTGLTTVIKQIDCAALGKSLNPLIFYHGQSGASFTFNKNPIHLSQWYNFNKPEQIRTIKGRLKYQGEGDGLVVLENKVHYLEYKKSSTYYIENQYTGDENIHVFPSMDGVGVASGYTIKTEVGFVDILCADIDNKWGDELIKINNYVSGSYDRVDFHVYKTVFNGAIPKSYTRTFNFSTLLDNNGKKSINPKFYYTGDFTGDGKTEILVVTAYNAMGKGQATKCYLIDLEGNKIIYEGSPFQLFTKLPQYGGSTISGETAANDSYKLFPIDYDGDGKTDICMINNDGANIYTFHKKGTTYSPYKINTYTGIKNSGIKNTILQAGDFNGDGKTDFLVTSVIGSGGTTWYCHLSRGNGYFESKTMTGMSSIKTTTNVIVQDMDNDGQSDIIVKDNEEKDMKTYYIDRGGSIANTTTTIDKNVKVIPTSLKTWNHDATVMCLFNTGNVDRIGLNTNSTEQRTITGLVNSLGVITRIPYTNLNTYENYVNGSNASFPYANYNGELTVAKQAFTYYNSKLISNIEYHYQNAVIHKQGLGFRGFQVFEEVNLLEEDYLDYKKQTFAPFQYSVLLKEESPAATNTYTYAHTIATDKVRKTRLTKVVSQDKVKNISITNSYTYDTYGNPLTETIDHGNNLKQTTTKTYTNKNTDTEYRLGLLTKQETTHFQGSTSEIGERKVIAYNSNYLPTSIRHTRGKTGVIISVEDFVYNDKSDLITHTITPYFSSSKQTDKYVYDELGRMIKKTNPLNLSIQYTYNAQGAVSKITDSKGNNTTYNYDIWGRNRSIMAPYSESKTKAYSWNTSSLKGAVYVFRESGTHDPEITTYYDAFGRIIRVCTQGFDLRNLYTDTEYDVKGRVAKESLPYIEGTTPVWNTYEYDRYNRLTSLQYASGKIDTYSYSGLTETTIIEGITTKRVYNNRGEIIKVSDPGGDINYEYLPDGSISLITAPGNIKTTFTYDVYGRRTEISDPSAGKRTFTYDAGGNINKETDGKGNVTTLTYDNYNRLIKKVVGSDMTITYTYDADGMLIKKAANNGTSTSYTYDKYMRLLTETETVDSYSFRKVNAYDRGVLYTTHYYSIKAGTNLIGYENYKYKNRHLNEIVYSQPVTSGTTTTNKLTSIWKVTQENAMGLPTKVESGNMVREYDYNKYGDHTSRKVNYSGKTLTKSVSLSRDLKKGNVSSRGESNPISTEVYFYDDLNRLKSITSGIKIEYDEKGNITQKNDVGTFAYSSTLPYAISRVTPNTGVTSIPYTIQNITYNSMDRPKIIEEGEWKAEFTYNSDHQRVKMVVKQNDKVYLTRYYFGNRYELEGVSAMTSEKLYLGGNYYSALAVSTTNFSSVNLYHIWRDHLGSIISLFDNTTKVDLKQDIRYDAWGRLREPGKYEPYSRENEPTLLLGRGYGGHEHLPWFGLINMNARLYDPVIGRFLSPDPYVQVPDFTQSFNRYSYCWNNPLRYTDESGEWFGLDDLIAALIGGTINLVVNAFQGNINSIGSGFAAFGSGAAAGTLALYGPAGWAAGGAIVGATNSYLGGATGVMDIVKNGLIGGISGIAGGYGGQLGAKYIGSVAINSFKIGSPVLKGAITGAIGGASGGYAGGFTGGILSTGSLREANQAGIQGLKLGGGIGAIGGASNGYKYARENNLDPWTGLQKGPRVIIGEGMVRVNQVGNSLNSETITKDWTNHFGEEFTGYMGRDLPETSALDFNAKWIQSKIDNGYHIYDIGPRGNQVNSNFYNLEVGRTMNYKIYPVKHIPLNVKPINGRVVFIRY